MSEPPMCTDAHIVGLRRKKAAERGETLKKDGQRLDEVEDEVSPIAFCVIKKKRAIVPSTRARCDSMPEPALGTSERKWRMPQTR